MTLQILKSGKYRSHVGPGGVWIVDKIDELGRDSAVAVARLDGSGTVMADGEHARFVELKLVAGRER